MPKVAELRTKPLNLFAKNFSLSSPLNEIREEKGK
jgi:hypothetical protein